MIDWLAGSQQTDRRSPTPPSTQPSTQHHLNQRQPAMVPSHPPNNAPRSLLAFKKLSRDTMHDPILSFCLYFPISLFAPCFLSLLLLPPSVHIYVYQAHMHCQSARMSSFSFRPSHFLFLFYPDVSFLLYGARLLNFSSFIVHTSGEMLHVPTVTHFLISYF